MHIPHEIQMDCAFQYVQKLSEAYTCIRYRKNGVLRLSKHSLTIPLPDRRGKHNQHPKIGPEIREKVRVHILFPQAPVSLLP